MPARRAEPRLDALRCTIRRRAAKSKAGHADGIRLGVLVCLLRKCRGAEPGVERDAHAWGSVTKWWKVWRHNANLRSHGGGHERNRDKAHQDDRDECDMRSSETHVAHKSLAKSACASSLFLVVACVGNRLHLMTRAARWTLYECRRRMLALGGSSPKSAIILLMIFHKQLALAVNRGRMYLDASSQNALAFVSVSS